MKDFIMCCAFVAVLSGIIYCHISWAREQIDKAYKKGYEEGRRSTK